MATLYVENVPRELYEALRGRARQRHRSIAAEVVALLEENIPTETELKARQQLLRKLMRSRSTRVRTSPSVVTTEQLQREDRSR